VQLLALIAIQLVCLSQPVGYGYYFQSGSQYIFKSDYSSNGAWILILNILLLFAKLLDLLVSEWELVFTCVLGVCGGVSYLLGLLYSLACGKKLDYYGDSNDDIEFLNKNTQKSDDFTSITVEDHDRDPLGRKSRRHRRKDTSEVSVRRVNSPKYKLNGLNSATAKSSSERNSSEQSSALIPTRNAAPAYPAMMNSDIKDMDYYRQRRAERGSDADKEVSNVEEFVQQEVQEVPFSPVSRGRKLSDGSSSSDEEVTTPFQIPNVRVNIKRSTKK
jgi:hypothetical protein